MRRSDAFFNNLAQVLYEAKGPAANSCKNLARWPRVHLSTDKAMLVALLRAAATDDTEFDPPWLREAEDA